MSTDKKTIGLTAAGERVLARLVSAGHFTTELEAAKFAMAHAARAAVPAGSAESTGTKWNIGTVDADGTLRGVIEALYPSCSEPYRLIEYLMDQGLRMLDAGPSLPPDVTGVLFTVPSKQGS